MKQFEGQAPPLAPGTEYAAVWELPLAKQRFRDTLGQMERAGTIKSAATLDPDLVKPGTRFIVLALGDDRRTLNPVSLGTEEGLLHALGRLYDRAVKQGRTSVRFDYDVAPAALERLRVLEAELPKCYAGAPRIN